MKKVLGIGNALVDILTRIDNDNILNELGLPKGSMQLVDEKVAAKVAKTLEKFDNSMAPGGSAANTIHGLAKCSVGTGFIGFTGKVQCRDRIYRFYWQRQSRQVLRRRYEICWCEAYHVPWRRAFRHSSGYHFS